MIIKRNKYEDQIYKIAQETPVSDIEDRATREMLNTAMSIINYRMSEKYLGNGTVKEDNINKMKNNLCKLQSEIDILTTYFGIRDEVKEKSSKRVNRIWQRLNAKK